MTTKAHILKIIRRKCLVCSSGNRKEADNCRVEDCNLWPYRLGKDPTPARAGQRVRNDFSARWGVGAREAVSPEQTRHSHAKK